MEKKRKNNVGINKKNAIKVQVRRNIKFQLDIGGRNFKGRHKISKIIPITESCIKYYYKWV